jgi:pimeloyl-ACP methyl ester carboxylesterase
VLEQPRSHFLVINGGRSNVYDEHDREHLARVVSDRVAVHVVPEAGHWVHAEAPDELLRIMVDAIQ